MTDRTSALTVVLEKELRVDSAQFIVDIIRGLKGVYSVECIISNVDSYIAEQHAYNILREKIMNVLFPD